MVIEQIESPPVVPKRKKIVRRGPPGVPCPSCSKLAGAEDEGSVEDLDISVSGSDSEVEVTIDAATLILNTACCGDQFKSYDLSGNTSSASHECQKVVEREHLEEAWREHCDGSDGEGVPNCLTGCTRAVGEQIAEVACDAGGSLLESLLEANEEVENHGDGWELEDDQPDVEAYQRYQHSARIRKTGKEVPIKRSRFRKSYRGITFTVNAKHELCGETEEVSFDEGDAEAQSGDFEVI